MKRLDRISEKAADKMDEPKLAVAPLIDVCFLLLIFFMVTTTIKPSERDLTTKLPSIPGETTRMDSLALIIHVRGNGEIAVNPGDYEILMSVDPEERELPRLEDHLATLMVGAEHPAVMVRADGDARHQRVVDVMNVFQKLGITRVGFVDTGEE